MTFFLLVSLLILLQHSLILWTAIIQPSHNFSTNILLSSLKSCALNLVILGILGHWQNLNLLNERIWSRTHSFEDLKNLHSATNHYHAAIIKAKWTNNSSLISSSSTNPRQHWKISMYFFIALLYLLYPLMTESVANFSDKIHKLHTSLLINRISASPHFPPPFTPPNFSSFTCVTTDEVFTPFAVSWH